MNLPPELQGALYTGLTTAIGILWNDRVQLSKENRDLNAALLAERERLVLEVKGERDSRLAETRAANAMLTTSNQSLAAATQALIDRRRSLPPTAPG